MNDHENIGYLTYDEFHRFRRAVDRSLIAVPWFRVAGYIRGAAEDEEGNVVFPHHMESEFDEALLRPPLRKMPGRRDQSDDPLAPAETAEPSADGSCGIGRGERILRV